MKDITIHDDPFEYVSNNMQNLCSIINEVCPEKKHELVECAIRVLMMTGADSYYEALGIVNEATLAFRDICMDIKDDNCDCLKENDDE